RGLLQPLQMQFAPAHRLSQSFELCARDLSDTRCCRDGRHAGDQARLLRRHAQSQPERNNSPRSRTRLRRTARPPETRQSSLSASSPFHRGRSSEMYAFNLKAEQRFDAKKHMERVLGTTGEGDVTIACWEPGQTSPYHCHPDATEIYFCFEGGGTMRTP